MIKMKFKKSIALRSVLICSMRHLSHVWVSHHWRDISTLHGHKMTRETTGCRASMTSTDHSRATTGKKANTTQNQMESGVNKTSLGGDEDMEKTKQTNHSIYFTPNASSLFRLVAAGPDNIDEAPNPRILTPSYKPGRFSLLTI